MIFSDASQDAYAAWAYVRWKRQNGQFESNLISSEGRKTLVQAPKKWEVTKEKPRASFR